jgi:hypothetical protein
MYRDRFHRNVLSRAEDRVHSMVLQLMQDEGMSRTDAAKAALPALGPDPDPQFVTYLSQGSLVAAEGRLIPAHLQGSLHPLGAHPADL